MCIRDSIGNMMGWFQVTPQQLEAEGEIPTPMGQTLYWDYYCYVKGHPIDQWDAPTAIPVSYTHLDVYKRQPLLSSHPRGRV